MKKIVISAITMAVSVMAMATETAYVRVRLLSASTSSSVVRLTEDDARTPEYESTFDSEKMLSFANSTSVLIYGLVGTHKCEDVMTNQLKGVKLGFATNQVDQDYTLKFENVSGTPLKLYDRVAGKLVDIVDNGTYAFSVTAAEVGRKYIDDRFEIGEPTPSFCFKYNTLEIIGYQGKKLSISDGICTDSTLTVVYKKDLSAQPVDKRLTVTLDGNDYLIDVNPLVTIVP